MEERKQKLVGHSQMMKRRLKDGQQLTWGDITVMIGKFDRGSAEVTLKRQLTPKVDKTPKIA